MRRPDHGFVLVGRAVFELSWPEAPERGGPLSLPGPGAYAVAPALRPTGRGRLDDLHGAINSSRVIPGEVRDARS